MVRNIVLLFFFCVLAIPGYGYSSDKPKNLLVIVTTDDPITQLMSMVLASEVKAKGANVDVLLCGKSGALAVAGSTEVMLKPKNTSPQMLLRKLIQNGASVEICPPYLPNVDKTTEDLIAGVSVAKPPQVAMKLLDEDTRILSY